MQYYEQGKIAEAKVEAKNAIKLAPKNAKAFLVLANCAATEQDWGAAFGAYEQAAQLDPDLLDAQLGLGRMFLLSQQYDKVNEIVELVLAKDEENIDAHLLKAGSLLQSEKYEGAQSLLKTILAEHPENTDAVMGLVSVYQRKGATQAAVDILDKALRAMPDSVALQYKAASLAGDMEEYAKAEEHYMKLLDLAEKKDPVRLMIARLYERSGEKVKAESMLRELASSNPENVEFRLGLVGFLVRNKDYDKALAVVEEASEESTDDIRILMARADILIAKKKYDEAVSVLQDVVEEYPDLPMSAKAFVKLAALYLMEENFESALASLEEALVRDSSPEVLFLRAQARLGLNDTEGAIADLRIVRKELPENYAARQLLARAYLAQDKGLMAVEELHDILESNGDYSPSRSLLVKYYARYGQWDLAEEELHRLLEQTPDDPSLLLALGDAKKMQGASAEAKTYYESVLKLPEGHGPALLRLGLVAEAEKEYAKAIAYYEKTLKLHPKSAAAIERKLFALFAWGRMEEVRAFQQQLLDTMPESAALHDMFGRLALSGKNSDLAEQEFRKSSELAPDWSVPYQRLIGMHWADNEIDKVIRECRLALKKNPDLFVEEFLLGLIYQTKGDVIRATKAYESVLKKKPDFLPAANNLAYLYAQTAQDDATLDKALDLAMVAAEKGNPEAMDTLGWVYHLQGNREQSIETLSKAYEKVPDNKVVAYHLAVVLAKWSYTTEARKIVNKALAGGEVFPERKDFEELLKTL
ncbi:tetratricopeptide repeat protein [Pseudodesulfovibrio sediminis]|uniref:Uncharacterized protein n=1 Tax=Pseudodesulfovibrio sediminis TaxID=2810563 RepID=A0ABN6EVB9_9BACT|nr:tetratricopeptide repeat protein [Pseudodesulfovibrio sediminis]BCS89129.1 hypothetical protein PSDVSF_23710 [Pseudodesulfovibrio sediminis]